MPKSDANHLTVIDTGIEDWQTLANSVKEGAVLLIEKGDKNPLDTILSELKKLGSVESLNIISHGSSGQLHFSDKTISKESIEANKAKWQELGTYLDKDGDINLFGCNIAEGEIGREFISTLAELTKADVAASLNPTGDSKQGGDWELEVAIGNVEKDYAFNNLGLKQFKSILAPYSGTIDAVGAMTYTYKDDAAPYWSNIDLGDYKVYFKGKDGYTNSFYEDNFIFGGGDSNTKGYIYFKNRSGRKCNNI